MLLFLLRTPLASYAYSVYICETAKRKQQLFLSWYQATQKRRMHGLLSAVYDAKQSRKKGAPSFGCAKQSGGVPFYFLNIRDNVIGSIKVSLAYSLGSTPNLVKNLSL